MVAIEMAEEEIEEFLERRGTGTLALTDGAETYAVPESFGYDGDSLYFQLVHAEDSRKMDFIETTGIATFTTSIEDPPQSVVVRGPLEKVREDEKMVATNAIAENAVLPTLNVIPNHSPEDLDMEFYRLTPHERTGRKFGPAVDSNERASRTRAHLESN